MAAKKTIVHSEPQYVQCAFAGCGTNATLRVKTKTGWANVCLDHDKELVQKRADIYCAERGLDTPAKQRAWVLKNLKDKQMLKRIEMKAEELEDESIPF